MNSPEANPDSRPANPVGKLLQSGILLSAISIFTGMGNYAFQAVISRNLGNSGEYGLANSTLSFAAFLSLPVTIATFAITHYIARFNFAGQDERLHDLLAGCRRFLFRLTIGGSVFALVLVKPLSHLFHFSRTSLLLAALCCVWAGLWGAFGTALCQGLAWFGRLALLGVMTMVLRLLFGGLITRKIPSAEMVVLASAVGLLANLMLLVWRKDLARPSRHPESPWNREFIQFLIVSTACVGGIYLFSQGDLLVAKRYFTGPELDAYSAAGLMARALPMTVAPMLTVLFTHRSGGGQEGSLPAQLKLLGLYASGLVIGAISLFVLKNLFLNIIARNTPEATGMITPLITTMFFSGLLQGLALWALASRWLKISVLYGVLGLGYWLVLFVLGKSPRELLHLMPVTAGIAFVLLLVFWISTMRRDQHLSHGKSK